MIPSNKWFPASLQERAAWFNNFSARFSEVAVGLGFTAADSSSVGNDAAVVEFLAQTAAQLEAYKEAVRQYRIIITESAVGQPTPQFPASPGFSPPIAVPTGIFERLVELVDRIRVAPTYTDEVGALLGILPKQESPGAIESLKPVIKVGDSFSNYKFTINVTRLGQPSFKVQIRRANSETWTDNGFGTSSPMEVTVAPTTPGQPERIQVRAVLISKNEPTGQPSDPTYVTVNP